MERLTLSPYANSNVEPDNPSHSTCPDLEAEDTLQLYTTESDANVELDQRSYSTCPDLEAEDTPQLHTTESGANVELDQPSHTCSTGTYVKEEDALQSCNSVGVQHSSPPSWSDSESASERNLTYICL